MPGFAQSLVLGALFYAMTYPIVGVLKLAKELAGLELNWFTALLLQQLLAWPVTIWVAHRWAKVSFEMGCPLSCLPVRRVPALLLTAMGLTILLLALAATIPVPEFYKKMMGHERPQPNLFAFLLGAIVISPIAEEWLFRGLILRGFRARYSESKAVWVSALLFGAFHLNPWQFVLAAPLGAWCAWLAVRSGSLLPGILVHVTANCSAKFILPPLLHAMGYTDAEMAQQANCPLPVLGLAFGLVVVFGWVNWRQFRTLEATPGPGEAPNS